MENNTNFIEVYKNVLTKDECNKLIEIFEDNPNILRERTETQIEVNIEDKTLYLPVLLKNVFIKNILEKIEKILRDKYIEYGNKYKECHLLDDPNTKVPKISGYKLQKSEPGKGFNLWHSEVRYGKFGDSDRFLVYSFYLNDIEEGGETEFLYQNVSIKPKQGTLCLFPADVTYVHRGIPPVKENKYIITGWYYISQREVKPGIYQSHQA